jgi:hypothetical protein
MHARKLHGENPHPSVLDSKACAIFKSEHCSEAQIKIRKNFLIVIRALLREERTTPFLKTYRGRMTICIV